MILKVMNSIGQDALVFSSDNQAPNGMLVKKGSSLTIVKTVVSNRAVDFIAMDSTTKARLFLNNFAKFKVTPSHSQEQVMEVTLAPSGKCLRYSYHLCHAFLPSPVHICHVWYSDTKVSLHRDKMQNAMQTNVRDIFVFLF